MQINKILIPNKPHLDPIAAIYLLWKYGQEKFPGVESAKINYWEHSNDPSLEEIEVFKNEGVLTIDIGGGLFDHHNKEEAQGETSTSLAASYLGILEKPELSALLSYVREDDLEGLHNRFGDLAYLLKVMYKQNIPSDQVVTFALQVINYLQNGQIEWHINVKKEFEEKCKILRTKRYRRKLKIGIIESDNLQVANYGITVKNLSVVMQKRSTGHVMILTNKNHNIDLREIVAAIRKRELELREYDKPIDTKKLSFEGKSQLISYWFYHRSLNSFLNGSDALSKTEATKVPFNEIIRFTMYGLTTDDSELCDCGKEGNSCPYRDYGFSKCLDKNNN
ncbi:MAG: hypothetical protein ABIE43_05450 [Patescibacteria group bacterium]